MNLNAPGAMSCLLHGGALLTALSTSSLVWIWCGGSGSKWRQRFDEQTIWLDRELRFLRLFVRASWLMHALLGGLALAPFAYLIHPGLALALALPPFFLVPILRRLRCRRVQLLESQIAGWLSALARALEAAPSLGEALEVSCSMCDAPLREEIEQVVQEVHLGSPLSRALTDFGKRVGSRTLLLSLNSLLVGRQTGGRLPVVLREAAAALREFERLEGVLRTKTAEGRMQAWVISAVPLPLYFAITWSDPHYFDALERGATGHILVAIAVGLWLSATLLARKILAVQI